jgi:hypothetical protein
MGSGPSVIVAPSTASATLAALVTPATAAVSSVVSTVVAPPVVSAAPAAVIAASTAAIIPSAPAATAAVAVFGKGRRQPSTFHRGEGQGEKNKGNETTPYHGAFQSSAA